jgi:hypothetical protein
MLCADMVTVSWTDKAGRKCTATALLEDISASGGCLQFESAVPLGAILHWSCPNQEFTGEVRYCVYREIGYFVGVEFDLESRWSKKGYKPQHLLDLQTLVDRAKRREGTTQE